MRVLKTSIYMILDNGQPAFRKSLLQNPHFDGSVPARNKQCYVSAGVFYGRVDVIVVFTSDQLAFAFFPRKCVESSGVSAKATAVSPTVFLQLREHFVKVRVLKRG